MFKTELLLHQKQAIESVGKYRVNALSMPMRSGKTRVVLEMFSNYRKSKKVEYMIIFAPLSTMINLKREVLKHYANADIAIIQGGMKNIELNEITLIAYETVSQSNRLVNKNLSDAS